MNMESSSSGERILRKHRRYIIDGSVVFQGTWGEPLGDLVNLGRGGMLIRSKTICPRVGEQHTFHFTIRGYDREIEAGGVVVGGQSNLMAIQFMKEPAELDTILNFMEQSHCPWTGTN